MDFLFSALPLTISPFFSEQYREHRRDDQFGSPRAFLQYARDTAKETTMSEEREFGGSTTEGSPRWMGIAVVALALLSMVGVGMAWNATNHAHDAEQALAAQSKTIQQNQQNQDGISQRVTQAEQTNSQMQGELNLVTDKLKLT